MTVMWLSIIGMWLGPVLPVWCLGINVVLYWNGIFCYQGY
mgnify:CR=1 FL=1